MDRENEIKLQKMDGEEGEYYVAIPDSLDIKLRGNVEESEAEELMREKERKKKFGKFLRELREGNFPEAASIRKIYFGNLEITESEVPLLNGILCRFKSQLEALECRFSLKKPLKNVRGGKDLVKILTSIGLKSFTSVGSYKCFDLVDFLKGLQENNTQMTQLDLSWSLVQFQQREIDELADFISKNRTLKTLFVDVPLWRKEFDGQKGEDGEEGEDGEDGDHFSSKSYHGGPAEDLVVTTLLEKLEENTVLNDFMMTFDIQMSDESFESFKKIFKQKRRAGRVERGEKDYDSDQEFKTPDRPSSPAGDYTWCPDSPALNSYSPSSPSFRVYDIFGNPVEDKGEDKGECAQPTPLLPYAPRSQNVEKYSPSKRQRAF